MYVYKFLRNYIEKEKTFYLATIFFETKSTELLVKDSEFRNIFLLTFCVRNHLYGNLLKFIG